jgi:hypothetical protein
MGTTDVAPSVWLLSFKSYLEVLSCSCSLLSQGITPGFSSHLISVICELISLDPSWNQS